MKIHTCAWSAPSEPAAITEFGLIEDPLDLPLLRPLISLGLREPPCPPAPAPCAVPPLEADAAAAAFCCALLILLDARTWRWRLTAMAPWMACMAPSHLFTDYTFAFITRSIQTAILEDPISQSKCTVYAMGLACWSFSFVLPLQEMAGLLSIEEKSLPFLYCFIVVCYWINDLKLGSQGLIEMWESVEKGMKCQTWWCYISWSIWSRRC